MKTQILLVALLASVSHAAYDAVISRTNTDGFGANVAIYNNVVVATTQLQSNSYVGTAYVYECTDILNNICALRATLLPTKVDNSFPETVSIDKNIIMVGTHIYQCTNLSAGTCPFKKAVAFNGYKNQLIANSPALTSGNTVAISGNTIFECNAALSTCTKRYKMSGWPSYDSVADSFAQFAVHMDPAGKYVVGGSPLASVTGKAFEGYIGVYNCASLSSNLCSLIAIETPSDIKANDYFGNFVHISGNIVFASTAPSTYTSAVYIYNCDFNAYTCPIVSRIAAYGGAPKYVSPYLQIGRYLYQCSNVAAGKCSLSKTYATINPDGYQQFGVVNDMKESLVALTSQNSQTWTSGSIFLYCRYSCYCDSTNCATVCPNVACTKSCSTCGGVCTQGIGGSCLCGANQYGDGTTCTNCPYASTAPGGTLTVDGCIPLPGYSGPVGGPFTQDLIQCNASIPLVWINEATPLYTGSTHDALEFAGPAGLDITGYTANIYDGKGTMKYSSVITGSLSTPSGSAFGYKSLQLLNFPTGGGVALADAQNNVLQFLCFTANIVAGKGVAVGVPCQVIPVTLTSGSNSLQLIGDGSSYGNFQWIESVIPSYGLMNTNQNLHGCGCAAGYYGPSGNCTVCPDHSTSLQGTTTVYGCNCTGGATGPLGGPCLAAGCTYTAANSIWINEAVPVYTGASHFAVELAGLAGTSVTGYSIVVYSAGKSRATYTLSGALSTSGGAYGYFAYSILNFPGNVGYALVDPAGQVLQYICFGSTVYPGTSGPALGMNCVTAGVTLTDGSQSLILTGSGGKATEFTWAIGTQSAAAVNSGQTVLNQCSQG